MGENLVLQTTRRLIESPKYVKIDTHKINDVAENFAPQDLKIPSWKEPVFIDENNQDTIDYFLLGNSINFAFTDFDSGVKYSTRFMGTEWKGAFGMWAALKNAIQEGTPLLDGDYLRQISEGDMKRIFSGNIQIPILNERLNIFREVGDILCQKYAGHFHNLVSESNQRLFNDGQGIVERLIRDFPSFDDSTAYLGQTVRFDKRAQLGPAMLYGRFSNQGQFHVDDIENLTVFADYVLPKALRDLGILVYEPSLANKVDNQQIIDAKSQEELELRASTIHAAKMLQDRINEYRPENNINALHVDYKLWAESRTKPSKHHLTITTAY